jgi:hypothetical protein
MNFKMYSAVAALTGLLAIIAVGPASAHHSDLQKAGKAIQYTTRKDTENLSIDTHRAEKKNSIQHVRNHHYKQIITPAGDKIWFHHPMHKKMMKKHM